MNIKYLKILSYFHVYYDKDNCPQTTSYVEMDDIHDSLIYNGINLDNEERFYVIKAKQFAINRRNNKVRQLALLEREKHKASTGDTSELSLDSYGLTQDEIELCKERLAGIPANKSRFSRRRYERILEDVKDKLRQYISASKIRTKF